MTDRERNLLELVAGYLAGHRVELRDVEVALADMRREAERENAENAR